MAELKAKQLSYRYGEQWAVDGITQAQSEVVMIADRMDCI